MDGLKRRLQRISRDGKYFIVPMDHGMTLGPVDGLRSMNSMIQTLCTNGATCIVSHKGVFKPMENFPECGYLLHISANTKYSAQPNRKILVGTVEEALRLGADGVSVHLNIGGSPFELEMMQDIGNIAEACHQWHMPLLVMVYPRGPNIPDPVTTDTIASVARMAAELGADLVKTIYSGSVESFQRVVEGCPVPVLLAGGPKTNNSREILEIISSVMEAGAAGVSLGRKIFQHPNPGNMAKAVHDIIFEESSVEDVLQKYQLS